MPQDLKKLYSHNPELRQILDKVHTLSALHQHFISIAPTQLAQSSSVLGLQHGILSISVANAAVAAKLRQLAPELVNLLQNHGCEVSGIRFKVQVSFDLPQSKPEPRKLSKAAQQALFELSTVLEDSPLKQALNKMIRKEN